jgi:hypothetical protein
MFFYYHYRHDEQNTPACPDLIYSECCFCPNGYPIVKNADS